ncbi:MAG: class I tRNA ligase family protein, partial [Thermodesulfobacteriota bacterium]
AEGSIMRAVFPADNPDNASITADADAESEMQLIIDVITGVRNIRGEMNIAPSQELRVTVQTADSGILRSLENHAAIIRELARLDSLTVEEPGERPRSAATAVIENATIFISLEGVIDFQQEIKRLEKEMAKLEKELSGVNKKLNNEDFLAKAPEEVVEKVREKHLVFQEKHRKLQANLEKIRELESR